MTELMIEERISILNGWFEMEKENNTVDGQGNTITDSWEIVKDEINRLKEWVNDLQSGMYINCVYCGHRIWPKQDVPASMADLLKEHVENCPKHPMSVLKKEVEELRGLKKELVELRKLKKSFEQSNDVALEEYF